VELARRKSFAAPCSEEARKFPSWNVGIDSALESDGRGEIPQVAARNSAPEEAETSKLPAAPIASPDQSRLELITKASAEQCSLVVCVRHSNFCCRQVWFVLVLLKVLISRERFNCAKFCVEFGEVIAWKLLKFNSINRNGECSSTDRPRVEWDSTPFSSSTRAESTIS
jgi:hypothetical protein